MHVHKYCKQQLWAEVQKIVALLEHINKNDENNNLNASLLQIRRTMVLLNTIS